ncbi:MAG: sulfatase-like hydrolase/transferase [Candidatus Poribacteria bacterium]|nr:sulfatase-like hydrolase/transferase [Candidatus Poribacteria bacterium]
MHKESTIQTHKQSSEKHSLTRRDFISTSLKASAAAFTTALLPRFQADAAGQYNVLFIMVDDLRPMLGCYGHSEMHTPNIDRLAQRGTLFNRAYCQFPVCNPSRASILTGLRPETNGIQDNYTHFRDTVPNTVAFPQHFKNHGYHTLSIGKIEHSRTVINDELLWSAPVWKSSHRYSSRSHSWRALEVDDNELRDGKNAKRAVEVLEEIKDLQFLLAVGFYKPHLPFNAPAKYYDLYDAPITDRVPQVVPHSEHEIRNYFDIPSGEEPLSKEKTLELIRGYMAATSYMDAQVGRVLDQLDTLGLTEKTVVLLCGDHGFHLGEHETLGKRTLFEVALRSPLIVSIPGQEHIGVRTDALVELVDIYPTLCDACQLPIPDQLEGLSMVPVIREPATPWKSAAFSKTGKEYGKQSIRTKRYRYSEHVKSVFPRKELYDHNTDPDEKLNIANLPENSELVSHLSERLRAGWQAALPTHQEREFDAMFLPWDVNNDGIVDIQDLFLVANSFDAATLENPKVDVNRDGRVDLIDLLLVASHLGESSTSSTAAPKSISIPFQYVDRIEQMLIEARLADDGSNLFRKGIANLEMLIDAVMPTKTVLLPNYPNPFNPETWIPYDLAKESDVRITIYNLKGESLKQLNIGLQAAGTYRTRSRAAYWDGCNSVGEPVASGIYFYTLCAGQTKATRKMVIEK